MLKQVWLVGVATIAAPAFAQTTPPPTITPPAATTPPASTPPATAPVAPPASTPPATAPVAPPPTAPADAGAADTAPAAPMPPAPNGSTTPAAPAAPAVTTAPVAAPAAPSAGARVAGIVNSEFPSYDRNRDGKLSRAEFGAWTLALRKAAAPALKDDAANRSWTAQAFGQADADKSGSISKDEMTNFLVQGSSKAS